MTEPQATDEVRPRAGAVPGEPASAEREEARALSLREQMALAMRTQCKVDPDEVFARAQEVDLDDARPGDTYGRPPAPTPLDADQDSLFAEEMQRAANEALAEVDERREEERSYGWEP